MKKKESVKVLCSKYLIKLSVVLFWLLVWEMISLKIGRELILPSPVLVAATLIEMVKRREFWEAILFSSLRILCGFFLALIFGVLLATGAYVNRVIKELFTPLMKIIQAMPVASFIILALLWLQAKNLSVLTTFLMVVPLVYSNVWQGLQETDEKLLQMAKVFHVSRIKKIIAIYTPSVMPYLLSAVSVGLGLGWKAGIAVEVIAYPSGSIGRHLYEAKLYAVTKEQFAWTIVIIVISILFERAVMFFLRTFHKNPVSKELE